MSLSENLYNLGALLKTNLETKGISGLTGSEGLTTLANKILDIEGGDSSSKSVVMHVTGNSITLGGVDGSRWLNSTGNVVIDWGDGTSNTVNNPSTLLSHTYANSNGHLITFNGNITNLGDTCFYQCSGLIGIVIPDSITNLGEGCFAQCSGLTNIIIPNSVTNLEPACFINCSGLTSIIIPDSVTNLGGACFQKCSSLTSIIIPDSVTNLGDACFQRCSSLTSIIIPDSVTSIGTYCFYGCSNLIHYELCWKTQPVTYDANKMPVNTDTIFTIPYGTTSIYVNAGYPSDRLVEREPIILFSPSLDGTDAITKWTNATNNTENGVFTSHGSFLTDGWSNNGLWQVDYDYRYTQTRYIGLILLCDNVEIASDDAIFPSAWGTWEGGFPPDWADCSILSSPSSFSIPSQTDWNHITIRKISENQVKLILNNNYEWTYQLNNLPNWDELHFGSKNNPYGPTSGGDIQFKNIRVISL